MPEGWAQIPPIEERPGRAGDDAGERRSAEGFSGRPEGLRNQLWLPPPSLSQPFPSDRSRPQTSSPRAPHPLLKLQGGVRLPRSPGPFRWEVHQGPMGAGGLGTAVAQGGRGGSGRMHLPDLRRRFRAAAGDRLRVSDRRKKKNSRVRKAQEMVQNAVIDDYGTLGAIRKSSPAWPSFAGDLTPFRSGAAPDRSSPR